MKTRYIIGDDCITCGRCARVCPRKSILPGPKHYEIDKTLCVGCGTCAMLCPLGAVRKGETP